MKTQKMYSELIITNDCNNFYLNIDNKYIEIVDFGINMKPEIHDKLVLSDNDMVFTIPQSCLEKLFETLRELNTVDQLLIADFIFKMTGRQILLQCEHCCNLYNYRPELLTDYTENGMITLICRKCNHTIFSVIS